MLPVNIYYTLDIAKGMVGKKLLTVNRKVGM